MKIHRGCQPMGPFLQPLKGSNGTAATISVQEGMCIVQFEFEHPGSTRNMQDTQRGITPFTFTFTFTHSLCYSYFVPG
jgi:hypothetical protein